MLTSVHPVTHAIEHHPLLPVLRHLVDLLGLAQLEVDVVVHDHDQAALGAGDPAGVLEPGLLLRTDAQPDQRVARAGKCVSGGVGLGPVFTSRCCELCTEPWMGRGDVVVCDALTANCDHQKD